MKIAAFYENMVEGARHDGLSAASVLTRLRERGLELLYLSGDSWMRDRAELAPVLRDLGLDIEGMHCRVDFPADPQTQEYRRLIDMALEAGAGNILLVPGFLTGGNTARDIETIRQGMQKAAAYGKEVGIPVLMEDYDGLLAPYNSIAGLKYFLDAIPELGCAFDTGNFTIFHEDELQAFELFADRIQTVHLKDRTREPRHPGDRPLMCADHENTYVCAVGSGQMRIREILRGLKTRGYTGNVIAELYSVDPAFVLKDMEASIRFLQEELS